MYYPYFRGKQFELLALRESSDLIASAGFVPIIEPVRESLRALERALEALTQSGVHTIVIANPRHGDHRDDGRMISDFLEQHYRGNDAISVGVLLRAEMTAEDVFRRIAEHRSFDEALIHAGFTDARAVVGAISMGRAPSAQIFVDDQASTLYRRHFSSDTRILLRDGFVQRKNADYAELEPFSDLHVTYRDFGMQGYGDFLTVGDRYSESGGPAYAVAIHLTFIDPTRDDAMLIYHFISDSNDTPTDPAGKFHQALSKLIQHLDSGGSHLLETSAIHEYRRLHQAGHFPGLGHLKKLSIKHHLETLAAYHRSHHA